MKRVVAAGVVLAALGGASGAAHAADDELTIDLSPPGTTRETVLELRRVPKGTFTMGSPAGEVGREADEAPHSVAITRSFWLGKTPVTRGQYARFVAETHHVTDAEKSGGYGWDGKALVQKKDFTWRNPGFPQRDEDPVVLVTVADAAAFIAWVGRRSGKRARLPTEAEWEYAARGGTMSPWFAANKEDEALALGWFKPNAGGATHPVGTKRANAFGLFDMAGNVYEWCRDVYAPYSAAEAVDPENTTTNEAERRVLRGGSWFRDPKRGRSGARFRAAPGSRSAENGFRIAVEDDGSALPTASAAAPVASAPPRVDAGPVAAPAPRTSTTGGSPWLLVVAPAGAVGLVLAWIVGRRRARAATAPADPAPPA